MLNVVIAEAELELVPKRLSEHPTIKSSAERTGVPPDQMLLESTYHHRAMFAS